MQARIALFVFALIAFAACRKDEPLADEATSSTPLTLSIPSYVADSGDYPVYFPENPLSVEGVALGRKLFYEKALSDNYTLSCASCHVQANAFSDPRQFSIGTNGAVGHRQAMAVVNLVFDHFMFWDARVQRLEEQAARPVMDLAEMRNTWTVVVQRLRAMPEYPPLFKKAFGTADIDSARAVQAIAQFERTLLSFNTRVDRFLYMGDSNALTAQEQQGADIFFRRGHCVDCHRDPLFADHAIRNNGLDMAPADPGYGGISGDPAQIGKFKTPTLRNIEVTGPYMHDGRFATLEEVVDFYADDVQVGSPNLDNHMLPWMAGQINLSAQDRADLVAFLRALTDQEFLTNPTFSDPN